MSRDQREVFAAYLRAQLARSPRGLPVQVSEPQAAVVVALVEELARAYPGEELGRLAGELAQALRDRLTGREPRGLPGDGDLE